MMKIEWLSLIFLCCHVNFSYAQIEREVSNTKYRYDLTEQQDSMLKLFYARFEANLAAEHQIFKDLEGITDEKLKSSIIGEYVLLYDTSMQERFARIIPYLSENNILESSTRNDLSWMKRKVKNNRFTEDLLISFYNSASFESCELFKKVNAAEPDNFISRLAYNSRNIVGLLRERYLFSKSCTKENFKTILNEMIRQRLINKIEE